MMVSTRNGSHSAPRIRARGCHRCVLPWLSVLLIAGEIATAPCFFAQTSKPSEYEVKATYLYNFARFVEWPASATPKDDLFAICVLGQDPFGRALDEILRGERINGKAVVARRLTKPQDAMNCRVVFISMSEGTRLNEILAALDKARVLTVSDMPQFSRRGGMIQFVADGNKIRFEINLANAGGAGLTLSSELLKVAVTVIRNSQPGV
jgi:hypothetical protein